MVFKGRICAYLAGIPSSITSAVSFLSDGISIYSSVASSSSSSTSTYGFSLIIYPSGRFLSVVVSPMIRGVSSAEIGLMFEPLLQNYLLYARFNIVSTAFYSKPSTLVLVLPFGVAD